MAIESAHYHATYLQVRKEGLSYRDFQRLWRSHGDFAASIPSFWANVDRYVHNDPLEDSAGLPGQTASYDAIGELFYSNYDAWLGMRDVITQTVLPDEKRVFPGPPIAVRGAQHIFQTPKGAYKLFCFMDFAEPMPAPEKKAAISAHVATVMKLPVFSTYLDGCTTTIARTPDESDGVTGMTHAASDRELLLVYHFASEAAARSALASADHARVEIAENKAFCWDSRIKILTHEWLLKDSPAA